ncbi:MAG: ThuA domain-containing protein [Chloroflexota bacterium]|nr:MAG: ThuA domain-containing protein [Chloroflexota bacterium]
MSLRVLLLTGGYEGHERPVHYGQLAEIFAGEAGADLRITRDLAVLTPESLREYHVIVNWSTFVWPTEQQVAALIGAVEGGVGFLGIHGATATFWNSELYMRFVGSTFQSHPPIKTFRVEIADRAHPITAGVDDFDVEDERYVLGGSPEEFAEMARLSIEGRDRAQVRSTSKAPLDPSLHVLARSEGQPLLYIKETGRGRLHYNALGHDERSLGHPAVRRLLIQGLRWVNRE